MPFAFRGSKLKVPWQILKGLKTKPLGHILPQGHVYLCVAGSSEIAAVNQCLLTLKCPQFCVFLNSMWLQV